MAERAPQESTSEADHGGTGQDVRPAAGSEGGDPVCWLHRVCPECGRFADDAQPTSCTRCGARLDN